MVVRWGDGNLRVYSPEAARTQLLTGLGFGPPPALAQPERYRRGGYIKKLPADPWGRPYNYQAPGPNGKAFDVWSLGADGAPGGTDDNADIRADS